MIDRKILKIASDDKQIVYGEVYAPDMPDSDNDLMTADDIELMAHSFMRSLNLKKIDVQHNNELSDGACVVESFIARKDDPDFIQGAWVVGVHIPDKEVWGKIRKGEINGFSMEAMVRRVPVTIEMDMPPILSGVTSKSEGKDAHVHKFYVSYDENGNFRGGKTDIIDGHYHLIKAGTVTEIVNEHSHRFHHLDGPS